MVERKSRYQAVWYQCDNAKEFQKFIDLVKAEDIQVKDTITYTPEQNKVAKCYNWMVAQMMRTMLTWSKLPQPFWAEAVKTANYIWNCLPPTCSKDCKSPNELWDPEKPVTINHLRMFRCLIYVHIFKEKHAKFDAVSYQGVFLGYYSTRQFRVYDSQLRKIE